MSKREYSRTTHLFFDRLNKLDAGDRARLKRSAGKPLSEARDSLGLFYRLLPPGVYPGQEELYFLIATLYPLADAGTNGNLGDALRRAAADHNTKGVNRRIEILLDADASQLAFRLRQAIRFLKSNEVSVNWPQLLEDVLRWNHPTRYVQKEWARAYFVERISPKSDEKVETPASQASLSDLGNK